jgi:hypothetical protein
MGLGSFDYLNPADAIGMGLTPNRTNYLDLYDFSTYDFPSFKSVAIEKYDETITGFMAQYAGSEAIRSDKYIWTELERRAISYEDATLTVGATNVLTRAASKPVAYRLHEKVAINTATLSGVFIVLSVVSPTAVELGTYDADSEAIIAAYTVPLTNVFTYSAGIEVGKGSKGADFTAGIKRPYVIHSNRPAITRDVYYELGSVIPQIQWVKFDTGETKWYLKEIDDTRTRFLEAIEKKHVEGDYPSATSDAATVLGLQGTQGIFSAIRDRGVTYSSLITDEAALKNLVKHYDKVNGAGEIAFLCTRDQKFALDTLGRTYNANYGSTAVMSNNIGDYSMSTGEKTLGLDNYAFSIGGYTFKNQVWKYLNENSFRGNDKIAAANRINFLAVPIGKTPVSTGDQQLAFNARTQMNYLTKIFAEGRDYMTQVEGGFGQMGGSTNSDDSFKISFLNESASVLFAAEKFLLGEGV